MAHSLRAWCVGSVLAFGPPALATPTSSTVTVPRAALPPKLEHLPKVFAEGVLGQHVVDGTGTVIGVIVNVLIDEKGSPKAAVIEFAGFLGVGNRDVAIAWNALRFSANDSGIIINVTLDGDKLKALPEYTTDAPSVPVATQPHAAPATP